MDNFSSCVLDTSVIIKALFSPPRRTAGSAYIREGKTHQSCVALIAALDEQGTEVSIPRCAIVEIAAVSKRLADRHAAEEICTEVESSFRIVPEDQLIEHAKRIALDEGCPGFDTYFLALAEQTDVPLFTDDSGMHRICGKRAIRSFLMRDMDPESFLHI
jgi:predicted nucleic acid-binding protein